VFKPFSLKSRVGPDSNMDLDDVLRTKKALNGLGYMPLPRYGLTPYPDKTMINGIRSFQRDGGLRVDGVMKPDGPTLGRLNRILLGDSKSKYSPDIFGIGGEVGRNHTNGSLDILSTRRALDLIGSGPSPSGSNKARADSGLFDAVKRFQQKSNLKVDGWMRPGGETETELNLKTSSLLQKRSTNSEQSDPDKKAGKLKQVAAAFIPPIVYAIAEFFGMTVIAAWAWWQTMSEAERKKVRAQVKGGNSDAQDNPNEDDCRHLHYNIDIPVCRAIKRKRGKQAAARCYASASERYAACLRGVPKDRLPPLITWNN